MNTSYSERRNSAVHARWFHSIFHRLRQECYGLTPDDGLLRQRLRKQAIHELGHTLDLRHCQNYRCAAAHAVEYVDLRETSFCASWRKAGQGTNLRPAHLVEPEVVRP